MKRFFVLAIALLCLILSGCSAAAFFLSSCGSPEADLVIQNENSQAVWSITLDYGNETETVLCAREQALMEPGQSYGLILKDETAQVKVILSGLRGQELARQTVDFSGERLYLTLERNGTLSMSDGGLFSS